MTAAVIDFTALPLAAPILAHDGKVLPPAAAVVDLAERRARLAKRDAEERIRQIIREVLMEVLPDILRQVLDEIAQEAVPAKRPRKRVKRLAAPQVGRA